MKKIILIASIGVLIIAAIVFAFSKKNNKYLNQQILSDKNSKNFSMQTNNIPEQSTRYQSQSKSQAEVTVDVAPKQLGTDKKKNIFTVKLNTHSVELDFDFTKIIVLKDDMGNLYSASEWTGNSGWHHLSGDIIFPQINQLAKNVELQIKGINGVDRTFKWNLN